jgi:hypothetical protein
VGVAPAAPTGLRVVRSPSKSTLTFKRKRGVAKFTLRASVTTSSGRRVSSNWMWLQTSKNGGTWQSAYKLKTNSLGSASKTIVAKKKSTKYYRWYSPRTLTHLAATTAKQKVVIK